MRFLVKIQINGAAFSSLELMRTDEVDSRHAYVVRLNIYFFPFNHDIQVKINGNPCPHSSFFNH
jgi:hypothetical protein